MLAHHHHMVDQNARHADRPGIAMCADCAFDLSDHDAAAVTRGLRDSEQFVVEGFMLGAEVAVQVGGCCPNQRAVDG